MDHLCHRRGARARRRGAGAVRERDDPGRACIADALLLESAARFNDGGATAAVTFDGIVLSNSPTATARHVREMIVTM